MTSTVECYSILNKRLDLRRIRNVYKYIQLDIEDGTGKPRAYFHILMTDGTLVTLRTPKDKDIGCVAIDRRLHMAKVAQTSLLVSLRKLGRVFKH